MRLLSALRVIGALSLVFLAPGAVAKDEPEIRKKEWNKAPDLYFFEDSEVALVIDRGLGPGALFRTTDTGKEWKKIDEVGDDAVFGIEFHPSNNKVAIAVGFETTHWYTDNRGETWRKFSTTKASSLRSPITFHYSDPERIMFHTFDDLMMFGGIGETWYTTDAFKTPAKILHARRKTCTWAKSTDLFTTGDDKKDRDRTVCVVEGRYSSYSKDYKLMYSDDFFETGREPPMSHGRTVSGMIALATVKGFIVAAAKATGSKELALYVTHDTETWHRAEFGNHLVEEDAYTILESTNYSIQVQVTPNPDIDLGVLFSSNSNGTYFTKLMQDVSRSRRGIMDFEKVQNIQGIFLINHVINPDDVKKRRDKIVESKITFDDGRTFHDLKVGDDRLHLHGVTEMRNSGKVFSSAAPGIIMGNGNLGDRLQGFSDASLFISDDAGEHWYKATDIKGAQKYEFGDQGSIVVAIQDGVVSDQLSYSLNHGHDWKKVDLGIKIFPYELTTIPDSTGIKFVLTGLDDKKKWWAITIDFDGIHERKCGESDFEDWYARKDEKGEPQCLMGHEQHFRRRKANADCFIFDEFHEALPQKKQCDCTEADFECDTNFVLQDGKCVPAPGVTLSDPKNECKDKDGTFKGSSGWRLIPGNDCKRVGGVQKDDAIDRPCKEVFDNGPSGEISNKFNTFRGDKFRSMYYLERDPKQLGGDETVVLITEENEAWVTHDHGKSWSQVPTDGKEVWAIYPHQYNNDYIYFITPSKTVYYSKNRAHDIHRFDAPDIPNLKGLPVLAFHQKNPDWIMWTGNQDCSSRNKGNCHVTAHISKKNGADDSWELLLPWVKRCQFMYREGRMNSEDLIFCEHWEAEDVSGPLQLLSSTDMFEHRESRFKDMVAFATMAEYIVVAAKTEDKKWLEAHASVDGVSFAHAAFPHGFSVDHQQAYTVLDSATNSVFLHVTVSADTDREYGTILKSNSNGTNYVTAINYANRNKEGYVDWEKMQGLEGVALVNVVGNPEDVKGGARKKLKTKITHDDGSTWGYLPCPDVDMTGHNYGCDVNDLSKRSLHLHGYTERADPRETFSSPSAVGVMLGVGNVGEYLGPMSQGHTFLTKDGGVTWKVVKAGTYMWEYGDQGGIIVLVARGTPTNTISYSRDEGNTWTDYKFDNDGVMQVERITTVPSDTSLNFLLWGKKDNALTTVNLDFSGLYKRQCKLDKEHIDASDSDYDLWSPVHPLKKEEPDCLFGHQARYYRRKPESECYNGLVIELLHDIAKNCSCTRQDFECDFNYERLDADNTCKLIDGLAPRPAIASCDEDPSLIEYHDVTGYRKIPLSTCSGGHELELAGEAHPCPHHQKEFDEKHRLSGVGLFFAIVLPIMGACGVGWYVYNKWDGKFGRIRLGDAGTPGSMFSTDKPWISYPVALAAGLFAVIVAIPEVVGAINRWARGRFGRGAYAPTPSYRSRSSFARGRGEYVGVENDEGELLGEESDEEV